MESARRLAIPIAGAALALGIAADGLFRAPDAGLNVFVFVLALIGWAVHFTRRADRERPDASPWPWLGAAFFAFMWVVRDSETLLAGDLAAALLLLGLPMVQGRGQRLPTAGAVEFALGPARAAREGALGGFGLLFRDINWRDILGTGRLRTAGALAAGLVVALPIATVFALLFANADPVFSAALESLVGLNLEPVLEHAVPIGFVTWVAAGYIRGVAAPHRTDSPGLPVPVIAGLPPVATALGAVVLVFTLFVATQAGSLFRGVAFVRAETGLTLAEYARAGFFQLVAASALALPLVYVAPFLTGELTPAAQRSLRALQIVQLGLIALVALSALWRMRVYVAAYGLTEDRLYATAIIGWIGATIAVFARTLLAGRPERAAAGMTVAAAAVLAALNLANPDALIARVNLRRGIAADAPAADTRYLGTLSADAVPLLADRMNELPEALRCTLADSLRSKWSGQEGADWRSWNWSRARARRSTSRVSLLAERCAAPRQPPAQPEGAGATGIRAGS